MKFIIKYAKFVIGLILTISVFFAIQIKDLRLNTNIFSFVQTAPDAPVLETPAEKPSKKLVLKGIKGDLPYPDKGEVIEVPERINTFSKGEYSNDYPYVDVEPIINEYIGDKGNGNYGDGYVIVFTSDRLYTPEVLNAISTVMDNLEKRYEIGTCLSPFDYVTIEKKGSRLAIVPMSPIKDGEAWTEEAAAIFKERLLHDSVAKNYLYSGDGSTIMLYYRARGLNSTAIKELDTIVNPLRQYGRVALNGGGLITDAVNSYINKDLFLLIALCFFVILVVFYLSFHSFKAVLVPALISSLGVVWTLGTMALMGYELTIVTLLTPCLVLTLGSSYSIHVISEYFIALSRNDDKNLAKYYTTISKTIFFAMITTVAGFLALLLCRTNLFVEFGITISIGVAYCWLLSFTLLPAILSIIKKTPLEKRDRLDNNFMSRIVQSVASVVINRHSVFLIIVYCIFVLFISVKNQIGFDSNYMAYFPDNSVIAKDSKYFAKTLGGTDPYYLTIYAPNGEKDFFLKSENLKAVYAYEQAIQTACPDIVQILSFSQYVSFLNEVYNGESGIPDSNGLINLLSRTLKQIEKQIGSDVLSMLINDDGNKITLSMRNYDSVEQDLQSTSSAKRLNDTLDYYLYMLPEETTSQVSSIASQSLRASTIIMEDQNTSTWVSLLLIIVISSIACLSIPYGISTLLPVCVGVMFNYIFMWCIGMNFDIVTAGFSSIAIGCGVDDAIHFMIRLKKNRKLYGNEKSYNEIIYLNILETGRPIILTTVSVDAGLLMLLFASFKPIRYFGILMCTALTAAMVSTLVVLPPFLLLCDKIRRKYLEYRK